jgi:hypothetical protein
LSRKHFVEAACFIRENLTGYEHAAAVGLMVHLGLRFNARFDEARFRRAAGDGQEQAPNRTVRKSA